MSSDSHLSINIKHRIGAVRLDLAFALTQPWTVLFGPSGSGKTTILRAITGLIKPDEGRISLLQEIVCDTERAVWVAPYQRRIRWAGQRTMLFPKKTVRWNLAMGMGYEGKFSGRGWIDELERALEVFGLRALADTRPSELSGGERQRVSVARAAIGAQGRLLLLDEPFNGLDEKVRGQLIESLRSWLGDTPVLSVTHDIGEAFLLGAEVIKIADGHVVEQGSVEVALATERNRLISLLSGGSPA